MLDDLLYSIHIGSRQMSRLMEHKQLTVFTWPEISA